MDPARPGIARRSSIQLLTALLATLLAPGQAMPGEAYLVQDVPLPAGVAPEVGALGFSAAGELIVVLRRGEVLFGAPAAVPAAPPASFEWRLFARGLHNPLGLLVEEDGSLLIPQMPELTRLRDTDGDGLVDRHDAVSTGWGISGNYHETNAGPVPDGEGNWFVAIGTASYNWPTFAHVRGEFSSFGRRGRNFAAVPWKGWVVKITPAGELIPWASGFRANNGIAISPTGQLFVTDNQGDWRGTSPIYHVEQGDFCGHPSSLVWDEAHPAEVDPLQLPLEELDARRKRAAVELPHGLMCNSPSEPAFIPAGDAFGPFGGQMLVGDIAGERILRVILEEVTGVWQGACLPFVERAGLRGGNNRLAFSPDGTTLYVGQTFRGWGKPAEGLQAITYQGQVPFEVQHISLTASGFALTFTRPLESGTDLEPASLRVKRYHYRYWRKYGDKPQDELEVAVTSAVIAPGGRTLHLELAELVPGRIHQLGLGAIRSAAGDPLVHPILCYTINVLRE